MGSVAEIAEVKARSEALTDSSTAHKSCVTEFHCTGFSKFHRVAINPTEHIMRELQMAAIHRPLPHNSVLASATVLQTDARRVSLNLSDLYYERTKYSTSSNTVTPANHRRRIFVHCGVDISSSKFRLEFQGVNEATFSCPDESGWMPCKLRIETRHDIAHIRRTDLPIEMLVNRLREHGFDTELSCDAGRFVCNWLYYKSLGIAERAQDCTALFVHVPDLKTVQLSHQVAFLRMLLHEIANLPTK